MRTNEERIRTMHERASKLQFERKEHTARMISSLSVVAGLILVVCLACYMPDAVGPGNGLPVPDGMSASIFSGNSALGFIVIGIVAFLLGITVTVFCFYLKKWKDEREDL